MSNTICIKHGNEAPSAGDLQPYELGYCDGNGNLYIGQSSNKIKLLIDASKQEEIQNMIQIDHILETSMDSDLSRDYCEISMKLETDITSVGNKTINIKAPLEISAANVSTTNFGLKNVTLIGDSEFYVSVFQKQNIYQLRCIKNEDLFLKLSNHPMSKIILSDGNYGNKDPNTAGTNGAALSGTKGQLYFVVAG